MKQPNFDAICTRMGRQTPLDHIERFQNEEGGEDYRVWKIRSGDHTYVLKEAKGQEIATYHGFFQNPVPYAPALLATLETDDGSYLLLEYISGKNLRHCNREALISVLGALISMQKKWWQASDPGTGYDFEKTLSGRTNRLQYLKDPQLESAYELFLAEYQRVPRTLCHDDLLPFNVLLSGEKAVFIDWEYGGILPYPVSLVRFLAHCEEKDGAFFYMKKADKAFAVQYYYDHLIQEMGIDYREYLKTIRLFWLYEYCEWIYVGNKFGNTESERFRDYFPKAKALASELVSV